MRNPRPPLAATSCRAVGCNGNPDQKWLYSPISGNSFRLLNLNSGLCLGIENASTAWNATAVQCECNGNADQNWHF
ncbi:RICIN domain-containing protein [Streptomyces sp. TLI_146]|uniref:RICIN domain-containing protein n=1 Tax=Streptomyces sp. TLI_146 TaxID=1938858 RepID=UPI0015D62A01|nr:RICIN domain-containing protein [Streptomyces sp. TLI_146]